MMDAILVEYWTGLTAAEQQSMIIIVAAAVTFVILERIFPYTKNQRILREGFFDDLALYTVAQSYILGIIVFGFIIKFVDDVVLIRQKATILPVKGFDTLGVPSLDTDPSDVFQWDLVDGFVSIYLGFHMGFDIPRFQKEFIEIPDPL